MPTILVTGGCGFIGSHVVDVLVQKNYRVVVLDKLTYAGRQENLPSTNQLVHNVDEVEKSAAPVVFMQGDICDVHLVEALTKLSDGVIHLAAETHVDRSYKETDRFVHSNIVGAFVVMEAARLHKKRIVHVSTDEVYGHQPEGFVQENEKLAPRNPYSALKAGADLLAQTYFGCFDVDLVTVRPSNNFGPRQYPEKLIPRTIMSVLSRTKLPVHGDGQHVRDWLWVKDNARAIVLAFENGKAGEVFNIAAHEYRDVLTVVKAVCEKLGYDPKELIEFVADRKFSDRRYAMDNSRIRALGWSPTTHFEDGLDVTVDWYVRRFKPLDHDGEARRYGEITRPEASA